MNFEAFLMTLKKLGVAVAENIDYDADSEEYTASHIIFHKSTRYTKENIYNWLEQQVDQRYVTTKILERYKRDILCRT